MSAVEALTTKMAAADVAIEATLNELDGTTDKKYVFLFVAQSCLL